MHGAAQGRRLRARRVAGVLLLAAIPAPTRAATVARATVPTPDGPRGYLLARPGAAASGLRPLVLLLHGHGQSAERALGLAGNAAPLGVWLAVSEREGIVVAALEGERGDDGRRGWNDCRADSPIIPRTDDVAFVRAVVRRLLREAAVDPARVYAMGMSNGGFMAFRLALELDPQPAAVAVIGASMAAKSACAALARPVSVLLVVGTEDPLVPYGGGEVRLLLRRRGSVLPVEEALAAWRRVDRAEGPPVVEALPHLGGASDPTRAVRTVWGVPGSHQVAFVRVEGGGHLEPSVSQRYGWLVRQVLGRQNHDLEIAEEAWRFFRDKRAGAPNR